jgi:ELWxxDGT repeat protein
VELWKTDGTPGGTELVKDINQQAMPSSTPLEFKEYNGMLYFSADDGIHGRELWVTDGTTDGTQLFKDINTAGGSSPRFFTLYNNMMYFEASDGVHGFEFWVTDGTETGTVMVKDMNPGGNGGLLRMVEYNGLLWFSAEDGVHGRELWVSDGTTEGTQLFFDFNPSGSGLPGYLTVQPAPVEYNNNLYLIADDGQNGYELWLTDGTTEGTYKIIPSGATVYSPLGNTNEMTVFNLALYFPAEYNDVGKEPWRVVDGNIIVDEDESNTNQIKIFPNPCTGAARLSYKINDKGYLITDMYAMSGMRIKRLMNEEKMPGEYEMRIDVSDLAAGVYLIRIKAGGQIELRKLVVMR